VRKIRLIIDNELIKKYHEYYFAKYPKRKKPPIERAIPPSLNAFIALRRMAQNGLKQKYKEFAVWLAYYYKIDNMNLSKAKITYIFYFSDHRRRDFDNFILAPKFFDDGFVESRTFRDDNGENLKLEFENFRYDKQNGRMEIIISYEQKDI
jgi:hypothetical protein